MGLPLICQIKKSKVCSLNMLVFLSLKYIQMQTIAGVYSHLTKISDSDQRN